MCYHSWTPLHFRGTQAEPLDRACLSRGSACAGPRLCRRALRSTRGCAASGCTGSAWLLLHALWCSDGGDIQMLAEPTPLHYVAFIDHSSKSRPSGRLLCVIVADHTTSSSWRMSAPGLIGTNRLRRKRSELNKLAPDPPVDSISLIFLAAWAKAADRAV